MVPGYDRHVAAVIHVDRDPGGYADRPRAYTVRIDGEQRGGAVKHGSYIRLERSAPA